MIFLFNLTTIYIVGFLIKEVYIFMIMKKIVLLFALIFASSSLIAQETHNRFLGKADAPVTLYEFSSISCIHCANFSETILPKIKEKYIDTGKAKLVFMDVPFGGSINLFAHSVLYQTKNNEDFFKLVSVLLKNQAKLKSFNDVKTYAKLMGLTDKDLTKAENKDFQEQLVQNSQKYLKSLGVEGTPTLFIMKSGEPLTSSSVKLVGTPNFSAVEREIEKALKK